MPSLLGQMPTSDHIHPRLRIDPAAVAQHLVTFLQDSVRRRFGYEKVILGLSGGVDSACVALLCNRAFGAANVHALRLPYRELGADGLVLAQQLIESSAMQGETVDITAMVDAYAEEEGTMNWHRRGNVAARARAAVIFDKMARYRALPVGTGNRTEILFGYFTHGGDNLPPINPIGDLYKTQVWQLAEYLGVPREIVDRTPSAGLEPDQTDEGDFGFSYREADLVLSHLEAGFSDADILSLGLAQSVIDAVRLRVRATHRKRTGTLIPQVQPTPPDPVFFFGPRPHQS